MIEQQPGSPAAAPYNMPQPGIFGTKIPSAVAMGIGVLLFFMPFVHIKCNNMVLQSVSGVQLATGFKIERPASGNTLFDELEKMNKEKGDSKIITESSDPNLFAMIALALAVIAFVLSLLNGRSAVTGSVITAALCTVTLVATLIDVSQKIKLELPDKTRKVVGLEKFGEGMYIAVDFAPWFYITIIAFAAGAWFCYKRMQLVK